MNFTKSFKIVFLGTPEFAVPSLENLLAHGIDVPLIITQPDKAAGRGQKFIESPIKKLAQSRGIAIRQPMKIREDRELIDELKSLQPDLMVTVAFGQIISEEIIQIPKLGIWNVHASLLPRWRGAAPINWSILEGDQETGITIMLTEKGLDTGPILSMKSIPIEQNDNATSLTIKLSKIGSDLLLETISLKLENKITPMIQDERLVTYASKLSKALSPIDWKSMSAKQIFSRMKALCPWPGVTFRTAKEDIVKLIEAIYLESDQSLQSKAFPGEIVVIDKEDFLIQCNKDILRVKKVQPPNKGEIKAADWIRGARLGERIQLF